MLALMLILATCLTGCSSGGSGPTADITFKLEDTGVTFKGKAVPFTEYSGYTAKIENGAGGASYTMTLEAGNDLTSISVNTQSILEENMDKIKNRYYYTEYLGSKITMAEQVSDEYIEIIQVYVDGIDSKVAATYCSNYMEDIVLTNGKVKLDCGDFIVGNDYDTLTIRTDYAVIPSVLKVSKGTYECNQTHTITQGKKEYQLQKGSSGKYDYYMYDGYLIQLAAGLDISSYITFK